jgi:iron complex outermembrane receptor protein
MISIHFVHAQTGTIKGIVKTSDGQPEFVNIGLKNTSKGAVANRNGKYELSDIKPGSYILVATYVGLQSQERSLAVKSNKNNQKFILIYFILQMKKWKKEEMLSRSV